jgi:hypothetical protein
MGLLEKRNPKATRRSVCIAATKGLFLGILFFGIYAWLRPSIVGNHWYFILPTKMLLFAGVAAICEWQGRGC